jgi:hypothetical protein
MNTFDTSTHRVTLTESEDAPVYSAEEAMGWPESVAIVAV